MKTVPLVGKHAHGRFALVDDEDYNLVRPYRWHAHEPWRKNVRTTYAATNMWIDKKSQSVLMHKLITGWPQTDHIDHDGLNNQRHNLREATHSQNMANRRSNLGHSSAFKGVSRPSPASPSWYAKINVGGRLVHLGSFPSEVEAALAYDAAAREVQGEFACLNFPHIIQPAVWPTRKPPAECGTVAAYSRHLRNRETPCAACKAEAAKVRRENRWRSEGREIA